jgi:hypothetical protein
MVAPSLRGGLWEAMAPLAWPDQDVCEGAKVWFSQNCFDLRSEEARHRIVQELYRRIVNYYTQNAVANRLETLTLNMIQKSTSQPPKLRARGAEARSLVGFVKLEAAALFTGEVGEEATAKVAAEHLHAMYENLSESVFSHESLSTHSRRLAVLWRALEQTVGRDCVRWRMKPKTHMMQELCEQAAHNPSLNWTYRDEDFGGTMAALVRIRGGRATPKRVGLNALTKFFARDSPPCL